MPTPTFLTFRLAAVAANRERLWRARQPADAGATGAGARQLSGTVFSSQSSLPVAQNGSFPRRPLPPRRPDPGELSTLLRPSVTTAVRAQVLPTQRLLLPKGAFLDCTLETAIDSTLPGMTTCVMATDTFGVDGEVVLLERGNQSSSRRNARPGATRVRTRLRAVERGAYARRRDCAIGVARRR